MKADQILTEVKLKYSEWLEHSGNPELLINIILAQKISQLLSDVEYLNKRLDHVTRN